VLVEQPEQYLAGDVVRDVSDDAQPRFVSPGESCKGNRADIRVNDFDGRAKRILKQSDRSLVDLDGNEARTSVAEVPGQSSLSRPYFDDNIIRAQMQAVDNVARNILVTKKILSEGFFWLKHKKI
jgi:hypothetical protein